MCNSIATSDKSKLSLYHAINPGAEVHNVYKLQNNFVAEHHRISFTRMRLSSHRLRIETGRWARLTREQRLCKCGLIQDEKHALVECQLTQHIRDAFEGPLQFPDLLQYIGGDDLFKYVYDVTKYFEDNPR